MNISKQNKLRLLIRAALFVILLTLCISNCIWYHRSLTVVIHLVGSMYYLLFIELTLVESSPRADHIQSGESPAVFLSVFAALLFQPQLTPLIAISIVIATIFYEFFLAMLAIRKLIELLFYSIIVIAIVSATALFLMHSRLAFDQSIITALLTGIGHSSSFTNISLIVLSALLPGLFFLQIKLAPYVRLYSHADFFFKPLGVSPIFAGVLIKIFRSLTLVSMFLLTGVLNSFGYYLRKLLSREKKLEAWIIILIYSQLCILALTFCKPVIVIAGSTVLSYLFYIVQRRKEVPA